MPAASTPAAKSAPTTIKIEIEVDAAEREAWINDFALNVDVFRRDYCGYWAFGSSVPGVEAWLVFEQAVDGVRPTDRASTAARRAYKAGKPLPKHWYALGRADAERAYAYLVARVGTRETGDATDYDVVIQMALLGEVRYG